MTPDAALAEFSAAGALPNGLESRAGRENAKLCTMGETALAADRHRPDPYTSDIVAWATQQAALLKARRFSEVDWEQVIEEIEDVAGRHRDELLGRMTTMIEHWLKLEFSPATDPRRGWIATLSREGDEIRDLLQRFPSLRTDDNLSRTLERALQKGLQRFHRALEQYHEWMEALDDAQNANLDTFELTIDEILDEECWPHE